MSIKQAQEWLDHQLGIGEPLYAVMVQLEYNGDTDYRMVCGEQNTSSIVKAADWTSRTFARGIAYNIMSKTLRIKNGKYEVTRAFIVEKGEDYRVIEEVHADAT